MEDINRRIGKFSIPSMMIDKNPEMAMKIMGKMVIVRAENMFAEPVIEYIALSPLFQKLPLGEMIPEYELVIQDGELLRVERKD